MCVVVDSDCLSRVFNTGNSQHPEFEPLLKWILKKEGKLVYGGSKYERELHRTGNILKIIVQLRIAGKVVIADTKSIDQLENDIRAKVKGMNFNDHHLAAIVFHTGCKIVCTKDQGAMDLLRMNNPKIRPKGVAKPKIYKSKRQSSLLVGKNIADCCR